MATRKKSPPANEPAPLVVHMLPAFAQAAMTTLLRAKQHAAADDAEVIDLIRDAISSAIVARVRGDR